jgi:hypothetical protein
MTTTTNVKRRDSNRSLSRIIQRQPMLYDLHTHLLGMGNASFWVDTILMDENVLPTNENFREKLKRRYELCPLVWDQTNDSGFVKGQETAKFFHYIIKKTTLPNKDKHYNEIMDQIKQKNFSPVLDKLIDPNFYDKLLDQNLTFKKDFSYDVVLTLSNLSDGLGVKQNTHNDLKQLAVTEKLGVYPPKKINFREWIIFNAREQAFEIVYGVQVEELRRLIKYDPNKASKAKEVARAHIINAFSMCDAQGTPARHVDLHGFHGSFTPEFYPRRFALKDSIYSQRLDILATLIAHIIHRYQACLPPVGYCEFSISVNDLSRPWIFDVLRSVRIYDETIRVQSQMHEQKRTYMATPELSSFSQLVLNNHFPHLKTAFICPKYDNGGAVCPITTQVTYKFLAGFNRQKIKVSQFNDANGALRFLLEHPQDAILLMLKEIIKSKKESQSSAISIAGQFTTGTNEDGIFKDLLDQLDNLENKANKMPAFYDWIVGLDLFGDELGHPYCPFVAHKFIKYIRKRRDVAVNTGSKNIFGVRIHCGENVTFADDKTQAYRLFVSHMYIVFRSLRFLQQELGYGIRIGHGIAFDRILGKSMSISRYRKSSVLLAEIREHAKHLMKTIAFEVNITSNEYLLGQTLRQGDDRQPLRLDGLFGKVPIIFATDDDGVWPIDQCSFSHSGHHSLTAEYCRAISSGLIKKAGQLKSVLRDTKNFCFWNTDQVMPKPLPEDALPVDDPLINSVIIHPDIVRRLYQLFIKKKVQVNPAAFKTFASSTQNTEIIEWTNEPGALRVAFFCVCANHDKTNEEEEVKSTIRADYYDLFEKDDTEFNNLYDLWREVRSEFIFFDNDRKFNQTSNIGHNVLLKQEGEHSHLVYSPPQPKDPTQSQDESLIEFIRQFRLIKCTIHAYGNRINIEKTLDALQVLANGPGSSRAYKDTTLYIYTNTNEYKHVLPKLREKINVKINPHHSNRDRSKESFLYVLCPNASAATAALHLISETTLHELDHENCYFMFGKATPTNAEQYTTSEGLTVPSSTDGLELPRSSNDNGLTTNPDAKID